MPVKIRLRRMGAKKKPFYRVVVADSRTPRDGRFIELLGYYDPRAEPRVIKIDEERAIFWLKRGAQPTDTAAALLKKEGILGKYQAQKTGQPVAEVVPEVVEEKKPRKRKVAAEAEAPPVEAAEVAEVEAPAEEPQAEAAEVAKVEEAPAVEPEAVEAAVEEEAPTAEPQAAAEVVEVEAEAETEVAEEERTTE